jgi:hypothetical protein
VNPVAGFDIATFFVDNGPSRLPSCNVATVTSFAAVAAAVVCRRAVQRAIVV